VKLKVKER